MKTISILGATGSIGQNTLDLVSRERNKFQVKGLTGSKNIKLLAQSAIKFGVDVVATADDEKYLDLKSILRDYFIQLKEWELKFLTLKKKLMKHLKA